MAQPSVQGRFIWEELTAEDPSAASAFYSKVLGWHTQAFAADSSYTVFNAARGGVAGASAPRAPGARNGWLTYIGSDDVDASVATAERLGGKVQSAAMDIPQVGRIAVLVDPQGANFGIIKPLPMESATPRTGAPQAGEFAWRELSTSDPEAALKFYQALFGWQLIHKMDMGPSGSYWIFGVGGTQAGGIFKPEQLAHGPAWLAYAEVPDADKAAAAVSKAGGRVLHGPSDVPGGRMARIADPSGTPFAVHSAKAAAATPPASAAAASSTSTPSAPTPAPPKPAPPKPAPPPKPAAPKPAPTPTAPPAKPAAATPPAAAPRPAAPK